MIKYLIIVSALFLASCDSNVPEHFSDREKLSIIQHQLSPTTRNMRFIFRRYYFNSKEVLFSDYYSKGNHSPIFLSFYEGDCNHIEVNTKLYPDSLLPDPIAFNRISKSICKLGILRFESDTLGNYYVGFKRNDQLDYAFTRDTASLSKEHSYLHFSDFWWEVH